MAKERDTFTQKEIAAGINNAVAFALRPAKLKEIPEERLRKLREYAKAIIEVPLDDMREEFIRPEELVLTLLVAALFVQLTEVMHTVKLPFGDLAKEIFE